MIKPSAMFPVLVTENLEAQEAFYSATFGFEAVFHDPNFYLHLLHPESGVQLGFLLPGLDSQPGFLHNTAGQDGMVISLEVDDAKSALHTAEELGLDFAMEYKQEVWGQNHFMVRDPGGFVVDIVEHVKN